MPRTANLVFVLTRPRGRFATVVSALSELWAGQLPAMSRVDAMYDATRDRVLLTGHYDARQLTDGVRTRIQIIARDAGVVVLDGANLEHEDKAALVEGGEHHVADQPAIAIAMWSLSRLMGGEEVWAGQPEPLLPTRGRAITANEIADRAYGAQRSRPVGIVPAHESPPIAARTVTPGSLPAPARSRSAGSAMPPPLPRTRTGSGRSKPPSGAMHDKRQGEPPEVRDEIREESARLPRGSRTSTLRDVVSTRPIGQRGGPPSAPPPQPLPPRPPQAAPADLLDISGRSAEDGTAPKASASNPGFGPRPASASNPGFGPRPASASNPGFGPRPGSTTRSSLKPITEPDPDSIEPFESPSERGLDGMPRAVRRDLDRVVPARTASDLGIPMGVAVPEPLMAPIDASGPVRALPLVTLRSPLMSPQNDGRPETSDDRIDSGPVTVADPIARTAFGTDAEMATLQHRSDTANIDVRYLRSGRWAPARLRALSLKGAYLVTAAFPRVGDHVHIALGLGDLGALVRGVAFHVTTAADVAKTGTSGFAVRFDLDEPARAQLSVLLHRARAHGITITPPPPRGSIRLPVQWPIKLATNRGAVKGDALDVSRGGMFIHPSRTLLVDTPVSFSAVLDDGTSPVSGRARVVRELSETDAARRGLRAGFGLLIEEMGDSDLERWNMFLARVQRRSEYRILVGAPAARLDEVTAGLASAGYAVVGGTDPGTLVQLSDAESRPPDVAVIDAALLEGSEPNWLETLFSARKVPCVTLRGDARRARLVVDRLLAV